MQQMKMVLFCMIYINQPVLQLYLKMLQNINGCVLHSTVWVVWKKCFFRFNFSNSNSFPSQFLASLYMLHFMGGFYAQSHLIVFLLTQRKIQMFFTGWTFLSTGLLFLSLPGPQPQQHLSNIIPKAYIPKLCLHFFFFACKAFYPQFKACLVSLWFQLRCHVV